MQIKKEEKIKQINQVCSQLWKSIQTEQFEHKELLKQKINIFLKDYETKTMQFTNEYLKQSSKLKIIFKTDPKINAEEKVTQKIQNIQSQQQNKKKAVKLSDPNIFIYSYELLCNYQFFEKIIRSQKIQKKTDEMINSYEILKQFNQNSELIYLSYKKFLIISAREFVYVRMFIKNKQTNFQSKPVHWIITFSVPYEKQIQKIRAEIILTITKVIQSSDGNSISVKVFSEVDMKTSIKAQMAKTKGFSEINKYIQKIYQYAQNSSKDKQDLCLQS